jgi:hypothetical protein
MAKKRPIEEGFEYDPKELDLTDPDVADEMFDMFREHGLTPELVKSSEDRALYVEWLKTH